MNATDTNVFAYAFDPADPGKQAKARQLLSDLVGKPAECVYSEDMQHGADYDGVVIINPFA